MRTTAFNLDVASPMKYKCVPFILVCLLTCTAAIAAETDAKKPLLEELQRIANATGGRLGVSALALKTGDRVQFHAGERYPMASTVKVPIALKLLEQVDHGAISLTQVVDIDQYNLSPGSGELKTTDEDVQKKASIGKLLELMLRISDNTATDHLMSRVGGPKAVTEHLRELGVQDIDVDRPTAELVAAAWGFRLPPRGARTSKALSRVQRATPKGASEKAAKRFLADPRDTASPDAMVAVLESLVTGKALSKGSTAVLIDHMENCRTGSQRIKGELVKGVPVAHKTGTFTRITTNDIGIITLPWGGGPLLIAIYVTGSPLPMPSQERQLATAALQVYRYYTR